MKFLIFFIAIPFLLFSQNKKKWFFGAEVGANTIVSAYNKNSFQGGLLAEYYFAKQWSMVGRVKYFETSVINETETVYFEGQVIAIPINLKWEYRIIKNFKGNLYMGFAFNQETKSDYHFQYYEITNFSKSYINFNFGFGFSYFINNRMAIFASSETYLLGNYRYGRSGLILTIPYFPHNELINIGIKYNLKN